MINNRKYDRVGREGIILDLNGVLPLCDDRRTPASSSLSFGQSEAVVYLKSGLT